MKDNMVPGEMPQSYAALKVGFSHLFFSDKIAQASAWFFGGATFVVTHPAENINAKSTKADFNFFIIPTNFFGCLLMIITNNG